MLTQEIWTRYHDDLLQFIHKRVKDKHDAEDILQDVFRKIHASISHLSDDQNVLGWAYRITRNSITDYYRSAARRRNVENVTDRFEDVPLELYEETNLNEVVSRWLQCMIQDLDPKYKDAILLTDFDGLTQKELAERLGISLSGAKSRVQRAREKMKRMLLTCCELQQDRFGNVIDFERKIGACSCDGCQ